MSENLINLSLIDRLRFLLKDSIVYGAASALSKAFGLITFPIIARSLSVADFGFYDYLISLVVFFTILIQFGQDSSIARFYYEYENTTALPNAGRIGRGYAGIVEDAQNCIRGRDYMAILWWCYYTR